jgi:dTMP kinase
MEADHRTIAGLFVADRLDHLLNKTNGILKKLEEGYTVICDRYYFSSYAYHGAHIGRNA